MFFLSLSVCARACVCVCVCVTFFLEISKRSSFLSFSSLFFFSLSSLVLNADLAFARASRTRANLRERWVDFGEGTFKSETERYFL